MLQLFLADLALKSVFALLCYTDSKISLLNLLSPILISSTEVSKEYLVAVLCL